MTAGSSQDSNRTVHKMPWVVLDLEAISLTGLSLRLNGPQKVMLLPGSYLKVKLP